MFNCMLIFNKMSAAFLNLGLREDQRIHCHWTSLSDEITVRIITGCLNVLDEVI